MHYLIIRLERRAVVDDVERIIAHEERWTVPADKDFHCRHARIPKDQLRPGKVVVGNEEFLIVPAQWPDVVDRELTRRAQIITRKDAGFLIGYLGLGKESVVVESGVGSGGATVAFARTCKHVYGYEINAEYISIIKENLAKLGITNADVQEADFYTDAPDAHEADLVLLDIPEPWKACDSALKACALGGFIVAYTPSIVQAQRFVHELPERIIHDRTLELIDRDWKVRGDAVRPENAAIGHTAFLTICRRVL